MTARPDSPALLDLIGAIYDCVIAPKLWDETVAAMRQHLRMANCILGVHTLHAGRGLGSMQVISGVPEQYVSMLDTHQHHVLALWGGAQNVARLPLGEPFVQSQVTDPVSWSRNLHIRDFVAPQGIIDAVAVGLARDDTTIANIGFGRHGSEGPVGSAEIEDLRVLGPHLRRATLMSGLLDRAMSQARSFAAALDASTSAIILFKAEMSIVHANLAGERLLSAGDPIVQNNGALSLRQSLVPQQLELAVAKACRDEGPGVSVGTRWLDGRPCVVHVLPLKGRGVSPEVGHATLAAVFIAEAPTRAPIASEALALLYGLTLAEAQVMDLIVAGMTPSQAAIRLGKSVHTVRTHLNRVFDKTGTHRQVDLVQLASIAKPPV